MSTFNIKSNLKLLVAYNVGEVLDIVFSSIQESDDITSQLITLKARYLDLYGRIERKSITEDEIAQEMNLIRFQLLELIDETKPGDINFDQVATQIYDQGKFDQIIGQRKVRRTSYGMLESKTIEFEVNVIDWKKFFFTKEGHLKSTTNLEQAINLVESWYKIPLSKINGENDDDSALTLSNFINKIQQMTPDLELFEDKTVLSSSSMEDLVEGVNHVLSSLWKN